MQHFSKHLPHYLSLIGILAAAAWGIAFFSYDRLLQISISVGLALAYVSWGVVHHYLHRDLHLSVIIEYALIASLGLVIILSIIITG